MRVRGVILVASLAWVSAVGVSCGQSSSGAVPLGTTLPPLPGQRFDVFTTARVSIGSAFREHFGIRPAIVQPIEFPHNLHFNKGVACTAFCHATVTKSAVAGLPSVKTCMGCHATVATDRPRIQQVRQMAEKGIDFSWQRVYDYPRQAHVRFSHAPHIRHKVECITCHGDIAYQTVAERNVDLNMGFCVSCHRARGAPDGCLICHS